MRDVMMSAERIVGRLLWERMLETFNEWIQFDNFSCRFMSGWPHIHEADSVRELVGNVFMLEAHKGLWKGGGRARLTLEMPFKELLECEIVVDDQERRKVEVIFLKGLCLLKLQSLVSEAMVWNSGMRATPDEHRMSLAQSAGCETTAELKARLNPIENALVVAQGLLDVLKRQVGDKPLWDFFRGVPNEWGYIGWWPGAYSGCGAELKPSVVEADSGQVTMRVARHEDTALVRCAMCNSRRPNAGESR